MGVARPIEGDVRQAAPLHVAIPRAAQLFDCEVAVAGLTPQALGAEDVARNLASPVLLEHTDRGEGQADGAARALCLWVADDPASLLLTVTLDGALYVDVDAPEIGPLESRALTRADASVQQEVPDGVPLGFLRAL